MIVLDTHIWLWWFGDATRLSDTAFRAIDQAMMRGEILISAISAWEVSMLVERGRVVLRKDVRDWVADTRRLPFVRFVPIDAGIAIASTRLPGVLPRDPADRLIVATALAEGVPLITADQKLRDWAGVRTIW